MPHLKPMPPSTHENFSANRPLEQSQWLHGILLGLWSFMPLVQSSEVHVEECGARWMPVSTNALLHSTFWITGTRGLLWRRRRMPTAVYGTRRLRTTWSEPAIASNPFQSMGNPCFGRRREEVWLSSWFVLVLVVIRIMAKISRDRCDLVHAPSL